MAHALNDWYRFSQAGRSSSIPTHHGRRMDRIVQRPTSRRVLERSPGNAVEQVVEQADNAYLAVFSPLSTTTGLVGSSSLSARSTSLGSDENLFTSNLGESVGSPKLEADTLAGSSNPAEGNSIAGISSWATPTSDLALVNPASMQSRNSVVINSLFAPALAQQILTTATNINNEEGPLWQSGLSSCGAQDCTITGAAGTVVTSFVSESIGATTATVVADETQWQDDGGNTSATGSFEWTRSQGAFVATDQLQLASSGNWQVVSHSVVPAIGTGP